LQIYVVFGSIFGANAQLIDELRFKLARDLLLESDTLIGDIAVATGIRDKGNFARMFRRVGGLSPREFRKAQSKT